MTRAAPAGNQFLRGMCILRDTTPAGNQFLRGMCILRDTTPAARPPALPVGVLAEFSDSSRYRVDSRSDSKAREGHHKHVPHRENGQRISEGPVNHEIGRAHV